jgi:GNAT superfamily N-acetyltransferase
MNIRKARPEDAARLAEISGVALGYASSPEDTRRRLTSVSANPAHFLRVAEDDRGEAIGFVHACAYDTIFYDPVKYVMALAVAPAWQGKGVGKALLAACEDWARADGAMGVRLSSGSDRLGAHAFYKHLGYALRKEQKSFWKIFPEC